ncbi:MAG: histone-like nucleoid-structuring protein Lsr2 [Sciscionella sp.]
MAQKVLVQLVDDLDGSSSGDIETVTFALDGATYEIDLGPRNARRLRDGVSEFVGAGRRVGGRIKRGAAAKIAPANAPKASKSTPPANREQTKAIREWARQQGHQMSDRGRIPQHIIDSFEEAHAPKAAAPAKRKAGRKKTSAPAFSG